MEGKLVGVGEKDGKFVAVGIGVAVNDGVDVFARLDIVENGTREFVTLDVGTIVPM